MATNQQKTLTFTSTNVGNKIINVKRRLHHCQYLFYLWKYILKVFTSKFYFFFLFQDFDFKNKIMY